MENTDRIIWSYDVNYEDWREEMEANYPDKSE